MKCLELDIKLILGNTTPMNQESEGPIHEKHSWWKFNVQKSFPHVHRDLSTILENVY